MLTRRGWLVYGALVAVWAVLIGWQVAEHVRVERADRAKLIDGANGASDALALVVRSLSSFRGVINSNRLEYALNAFVKPATNRTDELHPISVVLLNATNGTVVKAGLPVAPGVRQKLVDGETPGNVFWDDESRTVTILNLVDLGPDFLTVVLAPGEGRPTNGFGTNTLGTNGFPMNGFGPPGGPLPPDGAASNSPARMADGNTNVAGPSPPVPFPPRGMGRGGRGEFPTVYRRPPWLSETEFADLTRSKGLHGFLLAMPADQTITDIKKDIWLRVFISILATISAAGYGLAWGNLSKTSVLQIRLVRQSELNSHLKEMNLAAAGLAHETRNPLNIIRGLAQMISRRDDASPEVRTRSREIIGETDRITAQLNEFINYSRPREVRRVAVNVNALAADVVRALNYDLEEKKVQIRVLAEPLTIHADEQLLRQALFNLVINAIQAVSTNGEIWIRAGRAAGEAFIEVADNGPGVAPEHRAELFKPYFTTHEEGTGLGLAVVQQIVLAHGWEIVCLPNQPSGAVFRVTHIRASGKS